MTAEEQRDYLAMNRSWNVKCEALRRERDRLRAALEKYGAHHPSCGALGRCDCTCGLDEALKGAEAE